MQAWVGDRGYLFVRICLPARILPQNDGDAVHAMRNHTMRGQF